MRIASAFVVALLLSGVAGAQDYFQWGRRFRTPRLPTAESFDGSFNFCRLMYTSIVREANGQGWWTDYPDADSNFSIRLAELTKTRVSQLPSGEPNHLVVRPSDDALFQCPFLLMSDAGTAAFSDEEVLRLRAYLLKGGFLWADDFWGTRALERFTGEMARVLPPTRYPVTPLDSDHPLFRTMFVLNEVPQIPSIQYWRRTGGDTSERGYESAKVNVSGIADEHGRLMVLMTHNTDVSDAWEREGEDPRFFYLFSPDGYAVGMNVLMYTFTH